MFHETRYKVSQTGSSILKSVALVALLFVANTAQAAGYHIFTFTLTSYEQEAIEKNDPPGSLIFKGIVGKYKITTSSMAEAIATMAGCVDPAPPHAALIPPKSVIGIYVGDSGDDPQNGKIYILTSTRQRIPTCSGAISPTIFNIADDQDFQVVQYTDTRMSTGSSKQKWMYEAIYNFVLSPPPTPIDPPWTAFDLFGLATGDITQTYRDGRTTAKTKVSCYGRGRIGGKNAVLTGNVSIQFYAGIPTS